MADFLERILVLFSHVPLQEDVKASCLQYAAKVAKRTNNAYKQEISFAETDAVFHTIKASNPDGTEVIFANPSEVVIEGRKVEIGQGKEFNAVCLIYNTKYIVGEKPNHPVDNPVYQEGFNVYSIPFDWISSQNDTTIPLKVYDEAVRLFFAHEGSHSKFYLINILNNLQLRDKTHDVAPNYQWGQELEPPDFYIDLLIELKPYWGSLVSQTATQGTSMLAFNYKGTIYVAVFSKFVPISDQDTFLELGGNFSSVKQLTDAEFNSIVKPNLAKTTVLG